eukprot:GHVU01072321.1.p1 GENE.GHVU01072321.1~~GHVU01072321.1.p1  ORF type:complete len:196 (+),score=44.68 GHVU01072321.1:323-910(+)
MGSHEDAEEGEDSGLFDYYDALNITHNATKEEVRRAYREWSSIFHPDKVGPRLPGGPRHPLTASASSSSSASSRPPSSAADAAAGVSASSSSREAPPPEAATAAGERPAPGSRPTLAHSNAVMHRLNEAHRVLSDARLRHIYDVHGVAGVRAAEKLIAEDDSHVGGPFSSRSRGSRRRTSSSSPSSSSSSSFFSS